MRAAISKFTNEDRRIMGSMITKAKEERQLSNQDIANMTGFGASSIGRASRADNNTTDKVYINVLRALNLEYTPNKKTEEEANIESLEAIASGMEFAYDQIEFAETSLRTAEKELSEAKALLDEAYDKLGKLMERYNETAL